MHRRVRFFAPLHEEALGQVGRELRPHGLDAVHDLLLVADQRNAQRRQVGYRQSGHRLRAHDARLFEVVQVPGHFYGAQPFVHRTELGHVRRVRAQRVYGPILGDPPECVRTPYELVERFYDGQEHRSVCSLLLPAV